MLAVMRVVFVGGTRLVGPATVPLVLAAGHEVVIAHSGAHESPRLAGLAIEHMHGSREDLLAPGGPIEATRPDALVDTFAGGATAAKANAVVGCARRSGARRIVAISSGDVYQAVMEAGIGDGSQRDLLSANPIPIDEDAPLRVGPFPMPAQLSKQFDAGIAHDNVAMERVLEDMDNIPVAMLRPGMIYGPALVREAFLVGKIVRGERRLELPDQGTQLFARVAVERVARAIVACLDRAPDGYWPCNVVDPYGWTFAGLAAEVATILDWTWDPVVVPWVNPFDTADPFSLHPWNIPSPCLFSDRRLREVLGVGPDQPDPRAALVETVVWLRDALRPSP